MRGDLQILGLAFQVSNTTLAQYPLALVQQSYQLLKRRCSTKCIEVMALAERPHASQRSHGVGIDHVQAAFRQAVRNTWLVSPAGGDAALSQQVEPFAPARPRSIMIIPAPQMPP